MYKIAVAPVRNATAGRDYYLRNQADGKTKKEAMRELKRRVGDIVYRHLRSRERLTTSGPGWTDQGD